METNNRHGLVGRGMGVHKKTQLYSSSFRIRASGVGGCGGEGGRAVSQTKT